jgi:hypothetical protein
MILTSLLESLDEFLARSGQKREITICGGAALIFLGFASRETADIDVIFPKLDELLVKGARVVGEKKGFHEFWLNAGPVSFVDKLEEGWQQRRTKVFSGKSLVVFSVSRKDLIFLKLYSFCDRLQDLGDLKSLKPSIQEIDSAAELVLKAETDVDWEGIVEQKAAQLRSELGYD